MKATSLMTSQCLESMKGVVFAGLGSVKQEQKERRLLFSVDGLLRTLIELYCLMLTKMIVIMIMK